VNAAVDYRGDLNADLGSSNDLAGFLPPLGRRRERLAAMAMGEVPHVEVADVEAPRPEPPRWTRQAVAESLGMSLLFMYLTLLFQLVLLAPPAILVHALLR
jgi:hypothetical protein